MGNAFTRSYVVSFVRYDGPNSIAELRDFCGNSFLPPKSVKRTKLDKAPAILTDRGLLYLIEGDYVVRSVLGTFTVIDAEEFKKLYSLDDETMEREGLNVGEYYQQTSLDI